MKKLFFMFIGFMFIVQAAFASPASDKMNFETLNKTDAQILFQDNVISTQEIIVLDENQMNELKAKGWWRRIRRRIFTPSNIMRAIGVIAYFYPPTATASIGFGSWWNTYTVGYLWTF